MKLNQLIKQHSLSLISLFVAFSALFYNTWRNEESEANRNVRLSGFEIIMHVGELQKIAYLSQYDKNQIQGSPRVGWTEVLLIKDLSNLMSEEIQDKSAKLLTAWKENWKGLGNENEFSVAEIDGALHKLRTAVLFNMKQLE